MLFLDFSQNMKTNIKKMLEVHLISLHYEENKLRGDISCLLSSQALFDHETNVINAFSS